MADGTALWRSERAVWGADAAGRGVVVGGEVEAGEYDARWPHASRGRRCRQGGRGSQDSWRRAYGEEEADRLPAGQPPEAVADKEKTGWPREERRPVGLKRHMTIEEEAGRPEVVSGEEEVCRLTEVVPGREKAGGPIGTGDGVGWTADEEVGTAAVAWRRRRIAMVLCSLPSAVSLVPK